MGPELLQNLIFCIRIQVYRPGETISGAVKISLTEPKSYECIKINFFGHAHVEWLAHGGKTHYIDDETYVDKSLRLWPPQNSTRSIGPGSFSLHFQFVIPPRVPSSFNNHNRFNNGRQAYVSYSLEACTVTGAFRFDHRTSVPIFIMRLTSISDGNQAMPVRLVKRKEVGCLCCAAGNVQFVAKLPHTGFCVTNHDVIPLVVDAENNSTRAIQMRARIKKKISLLFRGHRDVTWEIMAEITSEPIQPRSSYVWNRADWIVPALTPTLLRSRIINVEYILEVTAVIPYAFNLSGDISLMMGNMAFESSGNVEDRRIARSVSDYVD